MTCIAAIKDGDSIYIGGDSAGVAGLSVCERADSKVFNNGPFIMGFTSSFRMGQLLKYKFRAPKQTTEQKDHEYLVCDFIDSVQKCFAENGFGERGRGGCFLLGYNKNLYHIDSDFQVGIPSVGYDAVGCGSDLALGSLHSTAGLIKDPEKRIMMALEAAAKFSGGVMAPFLIVKHEFKSTETAVKKTTVKKQAKKSK